MRLICLMLSFWAASIHAARLDVAKFLTSEGAHVRTYSFDAPQTVAAILQRNGSDPFILTNGPAASRWEWSEDGQKWKSTPTSKPIRDGRILSIHQLRHPIRAKYLRVVFDHGQAAGEAIFDSRPTAGELERWVLIVNSTDDRRLPGHGKEFMPLVRLVPGWEQTRGQQIWVGNLTRELVEAEPRPVAIFFSGSFKDWCEVNRKDWIGAEKILKRKSAPIWASCGGAQALAILSENGTQVPWDCPHCRNPSRPKIPIYTHIDHAPGQLRCGDYSCCIFEKGPHAVRLLRPSPAFAGLPEEFNVMESHCGQIGWAPRGWDLIATAGSGSLTKVQCLRRKDAPIYAAQFHIEMTGTPDSSRQIMANFLAEAESWQKSRQPSPTSPCP